MQCHACRDARRATTTLLLRQLQRTHGCRDDRHATATLLLRQLQHAAVPAVLLLYYYDN